MTRMVLRYSTLLAVLAGLCLGLIGCASVESTAIYYTSYTLDQYPPKPKDAFIPVIGKAPDRPFRKIGRLAFSSDLGYRFMRQSIDYNARQNGADAVILHDVDSITQTFLTEVPPSWDYVPVTSYNTYDVDGCRGGGYGGVQPVTNWVPVFQPGYIQPTTVTTTTIDAEMIVFKNRGYD
jgi:hypothetical protein